MNKGLEKTVRVIEGGGIVIFPTDTAFGVGCRIDDKKAIEKLFKIKNRSKEKAVLVLASSIKMVQQYTEEIPQSVRPLMKKYWPGGLTIILKANNNTSQLITGGTKTIGFRIPGNRTTLELIRKVGVPILAPSANFSGDKTPYNFKDLDKKLISLVDFVMPGRCKIKKQSTIVDCSQEKWKILREGAVRI